MVLPFLFLKNLLKDRWKMMPATPLTVHPEYHLHLSVKMIPGSNIYKDFISLVIHNNFGNFTSSILLARSALHLADGAP